MVDAHAPGSEADTGGDSQGSPSLPLCEACHRPLKDDIDAMSEAELLAVIHVGLLKDLARTLKAGNASAQELAVARGLLRDNRKVVPEDGPPDGELPEQGRQQLPTERRFPDYPHDE